MWRKALRQLFQSFTLFYKEQKTIFFVKFDLSLLFFSKWSENALTISRNSCFPDFLICNVKKVEKHWFNAYYLRSSKQCVHFHIITLCRTEASTKSSSELGALNACDVILKYFAKRSVGLATLYGCNARFMWKCKTVVEIFQKSFFTLLFSFYSWFWSYCHLRDIKLFIGAIVAILYWLLLFDFFINKYSM